MNDRFVLQGTFASQPAALDQPSGDAGDGGTIDERLLVVRKQNLRIDLSVDTPVAVPVLVAANGPFVSGAHVLVIKPLGGKVVARLTTADGAIQSIPVDGFLSLISLSSPITALDFIRVAGVSTTVKLFMAEKL
jgi:hypothetical protein